MLAIKLLAVALLALLAGVLMTIALISYNQQFWSRSAFVGAQFFAPRDGIMLIIAIVGMWLAFGFVLVCPPPESGD